MKSIAQKNKGFTLIELLVVIAIIGLLASVILASLNTARQKGRDSRRLSDMQQMANAVAVYDTGTTFTGCSSNIVSTCTIPVGFSNYTDPGVATNATACAAGSLTGVCNYRVANQNSDGSAKTPTTQDWCVSTYLEAGSGSLVSGAVHISSDTNSSIVQGGCTY